MCPTAELCRVVARLHGRSQSAKVGLPPNQAPVREMFGSGALQAATRTSPTERLHRLAVS